jgi:hypothetical protein
LSINAADLVSKVSSHLKRLGVFGVVTTHEPKAAPKKGVTASVWVNSIGPAVNSSGLSTTSARIELSIRLHSPMLSEPQDAIDVNLLKITDVVINSFTNDFTLGGGVESVDLLGRSGAPLSAETGYFQIDSNSIYRVMDITVPILINNVWDQVP